jgi:hypothetical protein
MRELSDVKFLRAMAAAEIPPALFGHREHLRLAFLLLRRDGPEEGTRSIIRQLQRYTAAYGIGHIFDEALTLRWVARLQAAMARAASASTVDELLAAAPELGNAKSDQRDLERAG